MVQGAAQAVDVGADVGVAGVLRLLGGHVVGRAHDHVRAGQPVAALRRQRREAEVEHLDGAVAATDQVGGLDVAVDHAALVGVLEPQRRLPDVGACLGHGQRPTLLYQPGQGDSLDVFHYQEVGRAGVFGVVGGDDVRMRQARGGAHLTLEALHRLGAIRIGVADDLERHRPPHDAVFGLIDAAHAALAEQTQDAVACVLAQLRGQARKGFGAGSGGWRGGWRREGVTRDRRHRRHLPRRLRHRVDLGGDMGVARRSNATSVSAETSAARSWQVVQFATWSSTATDEGLSSAPSAKASRSTLLG